MITAKILPYSLNHTLIGYKFTFTLNCSKRGLVNRMNILQAYGSKIDVKNGYISAFLNIIMSFAKPSKNGDLISTVSGLQFHNMLGNSNYQTNSIIAHGIKNLYGDNIIANYQITNG